MAGVDLFDFPAFKPECRGGHRELADKLVSEAAEAFAEIRLLGDRDNNGSREYVAYELADVMQVVRNVCDEFEISPNLMRTAQVACVNRNSWRDGGRYA